MAVLWDELVRAKLASGCRFLPFSVALISEDIGVETRAQMTGYGYKQTSSRPKSTSALPPKADILVAVTDFRS